MVNLLNLLGFAILSYSAHAQELPGTLVHKNPDLGTEYTAECKSAIDERMRSIVTQQQADFKRRYEATFQNLTTDQKAELKRLQDEKDKLAKRTSEISDLITKLGTDPAVQAQVKRLRDESNKIGSDLIDLTGEMSAILFDYIRVNRDHINTVFDQAKRDGAKMVIRDSGVTYQRRLNGDSEKSLTLALFRDEAVKRDSATFIVHIGGEDRYLPVEKVFSQQLLACRETDKGRHDAQAMGPEVSSYLASLNGIAIDSAPAGTPEANEAPATTASASE